MKNTPIMLLFFNRPDAVAKSFGWVRMVKPSKLFLVQDGARKGNEEDIKRIKACRDIVENIDWECEVYKNYSDINLTCDEREFTGIDWCFQYTDRLIILEDDCVPAKSFYDFCDKLLEHYKDDERIGMISGFVRCGKAPNCDGDYTFSHTSAGIGWATWKRFWKDVKKIEEMKFDDYTRLIEYNAPTIESFYPSYKGYTKRAINIRYKEMRDGYIHSWENFVGLATILNSYQVISPKYNMIKYEGFGEDATHSKYAAETLPQKLREMLTQDAVEIELPIKHPKHICRNIEFEQADYNQYFGINPWLLKVEGLYRRMRIKFSGK